MALFHWPSCEVLRAYARGNIFVEAQDVQEARAIAERDFDAYLRTRYGYLYYDGQPMDADAQEEIDSKFDQLRVDLSAEPRIITKSAVFIEGSE